MKEKEENKKIVNKEKRLGVFSQNLYRIMHQKGISVKELSVASGCSVPSIYIWLRGETYPNNGKISQIASALGVTIKELFEEDYSEKNVDDKLVKEITDLILKLPREQHQLMKINIKSCIEMLRSMEREEI